ncbi:MAG: carboxypeptidase regulatory-like domain-containing protein [Anaerolineae bacterium]|nr:carboxypeptidase regulatory-like domain-containing protein [Anaerolineae bacterium]
MPKQFYGFIILLTGLALACRGAQDTTGRVAPPTRTPLPTFTVTPTPALLPLPSSTPPTETPFLPPDTPTPSPTAPPTDTPLPTPTPTQQPLPPTNTPLPPPTEAPTITPTPAPIIKYVLAGAQREFNCDFTYIYGTVKNANNFGIPEVEVRALGIHETTGLDFVTRTDAEGNYEIFRIPFADLLAAQWAVMIMENGQEVSERFHWASTPVCESDDPGHSQVLRLDWKLIE